MAAPTNPFAGLVTPDSVYDERRAEAMARYGQVSEDPTTNFWVREAALGGVDMRRDRGRQGKGLNDDDRRAARTDLIMRGAFQHASSLISSGDYTPEEAQEEALNIAVSDFMKIGDFESAQALTPTLQAMIAARAERAKLASEAKAKDAAAFRDTAAGNLSYTRAEMLPGTTQAEIAQKNAQADLVAEQAATQASVRALNYANARLADRKPGDTGSGSGAGAGNPFNKSDVTKAQDRIAATQSYLANVDTMIGMYQKYPGIGSEAAGAINSARQWVSGTLAAFEKNGSTVDKASLPKDLRITYERLKPAIEANAKRLGVSVPEFVSLVTTMAYGQAKANDPRGIVTNADFANGMQSLGTVQNPKDAIRTLAANAERVHRDTINWFDVNPDWESKTSLGPAIGKLRTSLDPIKNKTAPGSTEDNPITDRAAAEAAPKGAWLKNPATGRTWRKGGK